MVTLLAGLALIVLSQFYAALALGPAVVAEFPNAPAGGGGAQVAFGVPYALAFLAWGPLADRHGAKRVLLWGVAALVLATVWVAAAPNLAWFFAGRVAQGIAAASFAPAAFAYIASRLPVLARGAAMTVLTSSFLATAVLGQVAAQLVIVELSWRWFFGMSAVLLTCGGVIGVRLLRSDAPHQSAAVRPRVGLLPLLRDRRIGVLLVATFAILGPFTALYAALGSASSMDGNAMLGLRISALPALVWAGFAGSWLERFMPTRRLVVGLSGAMVAALVIAVWDASPVGVAVAMFVFAACVSLVAPAMIQVLTALAPERRGSITALFTCALFLGASLAPLLVGVIAGALPAGDSVACTALGAAVLIGVAAALVASGGRRSAPSARGL